jgi:CheY-like chemotaxis protein
MSTDSPSPKPTRRLRILCADDHTMVGDLLVKLFSNAGHEIERVGDGLDAWQKISTDLGRFDVLITDQQMPGLRGDELIDLLRQANFPGRIIVHSAKLSPPELERFKALRVDHVVIKSTKAEELLAVVEAFHEG